MTRFLGPEVIVDAMIAKLKREMLGRVAAINLEKGDEFEVVAPSPDRYYDTARRLIPPGGPAILVMDGPIRRQRGGEGPHSLLLELMIGVWVMDEDVDERKLGKRLQRLSRAVIESLWDGDPMESLRDADGALLAYQLVPNDTIPGQAFQPDQSGVDLREFYLTVFSVTRLESD